MRIEQQMVAEFHKAAGDSDPIVPTMPSLEVRILRAKLMLEECIETIQDGLGLELRGYTSAGVLSECRGQMLGCEFFEISEGSLEKIADGCADLKYVTYGTELACGIDGGPVFDCVHESNMSKFLDSPHIHGTKVQKGPSFRPPDIAGVLEGQKHALQASALVFEKEAIDTMMRSVMEQREDILKAFVAKYGWEPDRVIQVIDGTKWYVRQRTDEEMAREQKINWDPPPKDIGTEVYAEKPVEREQVVFRCPDTPKPSNEALGAAPDQQKAINDTIDKAIELLKESAEPFDRATLLLRALQLTR